MTPHPIEPPLITILVQGGSGTIQCLPTAMSDWEPGQLHPLAMSTPMFSFVKNASRGHSGPPPRQVSTLYALPSFGFTSVQEYYECVDLPLTAGTSHSEGPSGSGGSCSNSGLDLAQRGAEMPHPAGTSHSEGPCSATNHSAGTSHSEGPGPRRALFGPDVPPPPVVFSDTF